MRRDDAAGRGGSSAASSRRQDEITFDRLDKVYCTTEFSKSELQFWHDMSPQARRDLLKLDKQTLTEHARNNSYCSRCYGLLLDCFARIAVYGKSLRQGASDVSWATSSSDGGHGFSVHPASWGGLSTTKDGILTLLDDCFVKANSMTELQNVFDNALARERERKMRYPHACSAGGRGCGTREMCVLHTARPSCDTLDDFWSPLDEETRSSLLRMREEDFIEKLTRRFDKKKFCRDCRKNVIREFKELKEPKKRVPRERRCNCWFCVENGFRCEVSEDGIIVDWTQCLSSEAQGTFHRFEWAVGTQEGESDISAFEDAGMNARVHKTGIDLVQFENYFITLRAWRSDDRCTEYCVKAHVSKGKSSCVHLLQHALVVGDGYVTITNGGSMKGFFERAEKVEEEDEYAAMNKDGDDLDANGSHTQKHAKSPELAREFLLDATSVIFKEQVVKAYRDDTAQQNATIVFVSLALKLLEERVHVACKELIILEKQNKLLEEEEKEMRKEKQRRMKRGMKEREKKHKQKQRLKGKGAKLVESKPPNDMPSPALNNSSTCTDHESTTDTACSGDSADAEDMDLYSPGGIIDQTSCRENKADHCNGVTEMSRTDSSDCCCTSEQSSSQDEPGTIGDSQWQSIERKRRSGRSCSFIYPKGVHNVNPFLAHKQQQCHMHPGLIQKTGASFRTVPPLPSCQNRGMNLDRNPSGKMEPSGKKDLPEDNDKGTADASFSLFQFSLPIASRSPPLLSGEFADSRIPLAQVQAQLCSREQTDVKEYKLFSTKDSGVFSFMQIK